LLIYAAEIICLREAFFSGYRDLNGHKVYCSRISGPRYRWKRRRDTRFGPAPSCFSDPECLSCADADHRHWWAGGVEKDVTFEDADPDINDQIDAAYRPKYRRYAASIIGRIVSLKARSATIRLVPRSAGFY